MNKIVKPRQVILVVIMEVLKNLGMAFPPLGKIRTLLGRTSLEPSIPNLDRYVLNLVNKVNLHCNGIRNKSILEIGPGDHLASGLAMLALGAKSYTAIDRFPGNYNNPKANKWYEYLKKNWPYGAWPDEISITTWLDSKKVFKINGGIEELSLDRQYDIVCSYAVGEHVSDVSKFAESHRRILKSNGVAMHHIDFGGHRWDKFGDPFLFLKFPNFVWRIMGSARGEPNRIPMSGFTKVFHAAGLHVSVHDEISFEINPEDEWVNSVAYENIQISSATFVLRIDNSKVYPAQNENL